MRITIRPAEEGDRATIIAASQKTWDAHRARQPHAFPENGWEMLMARDHVLAFRDAKGQPVNQSENLFVADAEGQIVGYVLLSWHLRRDAEAYHKGSVNDIWVHEDWRGKGIAMELLETAKAEAEARDWHDLTAQVWDGAPSADLFARAGFTPRSTIWRFGPDRPARPIEPREAAPPHTEDAWWKWVVLAVIVACFIAIASSFQ
ncbi:GNAT family N-acetyltransferase [Hasllibacter sp. MH4015]|uniref:GNAT family N-acetyltransferase n=1 Tax=Hasllibacter sp. MH4015 TaxID=2854029 RepID=UPI001CD74F3C|nr:GNAT family N-acetyltransferase [Hasllibacter sp. MH4015]